MSTANSNKMEDKPTANRWLRGLLVLLGYALLTVIFTRPLAWKAGEGYVANLAADADGSYHLNPYILHHCLSEGTTCLHTDLQCYPVGNSLALNTNMPLPSLMAQVRHNTTTGFNWVLLLNCLLTAVGGYLFARLFIRSPWLAFVAGALFAFWMGRSAHLWHGHANLMMAAPVPFALYALHRALPKFFQKEGFLTLRWGWVLLFVVLGAITALHDLILCGYLVIYCMLLVTVAAYRKLLLPRKWWVQVLVLAAVVVTVDQAAQVLVRNKVDNKGAFYFSGSIKNLVYPHPVSALYDEVFFGGEGKIPVKPGFDPGRVMFPGFALWTLALGVAGAALWKRRKGPHFWLLALTVLGLLYTFPLIRWTGGRLIYGPFSLVHFIPFWNQNRCPTRFSDVIILLGATWVLATMEGLPFWEKWKSRTQAIAASALLALVLVEHVPSSFFFVELDKPPAVYEVLAQSDDPSSMFVPFGVVDGMKAFGTLWLEPYAYQPVHNRKMVNGYLSRIDPETWEYFEQDTFLTRLARVQWVNKPPSPLPLPEQLPPRVATPDSAEMVKFLRTFQVRQVVLRPGWREKSTGIWVSHCLQPFVIEERQFPEGHILWRLSAPAQ
jgi:hypothetical protein